MNPKKLGVEVEKMDEIDCVVRGCNFLLNHIPDEAFEFQREEAWSDYNYACVLTETAYQNS